MSERFVPREEANPNSKHPLSPSEQAKWQRIRIVLVKYAVAGTEEDIDYVAHELWRASK